MKSVQNFRTLTITGTDVFPLFSGLKAELYFSHKKSVRMNKPKFNLLSDAELAQEMEKFENLASQELQMPPVMNPRSECTRVLSEDPDIAAGLESKMAFVDISLNIADRVRYTALLVRGVFLFLTQNASLCYGYSKELTQRDDSFVQPLPAQPLDMTYNKTE